MQTLGLIATIFANVRFGSEVDICGAKAYVRFGPKADIWHCSKFRRRFPQTSSARKGRVVTSFPQRTMRATNVINASPRAHPGILMPISRYGRGRRFNPYSAHHFSLSNRIASLESQKIQGIQQASRHTLRLFRCGQSINFLLEFLHVITRPLQHCAVETGERDRKSVV